MPNSRKSSDYARSQQFISNLKASLLSLNAWTRDVSILTTSWDRCDWGKKNFILIKKGFMFPIVEAFLIS